MFHRDINGELQSLIKQRIISNLTGDVRRNIDAESFSVANTMNNAKII